MRVCVLLMARNGADWRRMASYDAKLRQSVPGGARRCLWCHHKVARPRAARPAARPAPPYDPPRRAACRRGGPARGGTVGPAPSRSAPLPTAHAPAVPGRGPAPPAGPPPPRALPALLRRVRPRRPGPRRSPPPKPSHANPAYPWLGCSPLDPAHRAGSRRARPPRHRRRGTPGWPGKGRRRAPPAACADAPARAPVPAPVGSARPPSCRRTPPDQGCKVWARFAQDRPSRMGPCSPDGGFHTGGAQL